MMPPTAQEPEPWLVEQNRRPLFSMKVANHTQRTCDFDPPVVLQNHSGAGLSMEAFTYNQVRGVEHLQTDLGGLKVDGVCGPATAGKMREAFEAGYLAVVNSPVGRDKIIFGPVEEACRDYDPTKLGIVYTDPGHPCP